MSLLTSREDLKNYCLRNLGSPVVTVNVHDDQIDDRISEALSYFHKFHMDGVENKFYVHTITQDDIDNKFITLPAGVIDIVRLVETTDDTFYHTLKRRQALDLMRNGNANVIDWYLLKENLDVIKYVFASGTQIRHSRVLNKVTMPLEFHKMVPGESIVVMEVYQSVGEVAGVFNDIWIKEFTTQLIKRQWGTNLKKLKGVKMPGGIEIDGQSIYDEAEQEIEKLKEELQSKYSEPDEFIIG